MIKDPTNGKGPSRRQALLAGLGATAAGAACIVPSRRALAQGAATGRPFRIGVLNDQSSVYAAPGGPGSVVATRMAVQDYGSKVLGRPIEVLVGDHQNKPDIGSNIAREWYDSGVSAIVDGASSAVAFAVQDLTQRSNRVFLISGSTSSDLTGKFCSPNGLQWMVDTYTSATSTVRAYMARNPDVKTWFSLAADYTFGYDLENSAAQEVERDGGRLLGKTHFPLGASDFAAVLLQAQSSGAKAIVLSAGGGDVDNAIKQAREFGLLDKQAMVALSFYPTNLESLGQQEGVGLMWVDTFYPELNDTTRGWTKRFMAIRDQTPTRIHAGSYSAVFNYLRTVDALGDDDGRKVAAALRAKPLEDPLFNGARIREDGRVLLPLYLLQAKAPAEMKGPSDRSNLVATVSPDQAYRPLADGKCAYLAGAR